MSTNPTPPRYVRVRSGGEFTMVYGCVHCGSLVGYGTVATHDAFHAALDELFQDHQRAEMRERNG